MVDDSARHSSTCVRRIDSVGFGGSRKLSEAVGLHDVAAPRVAAPVKDADLEMMSMNLKEGGRCVVNRDEDMVAVDFGDDVSLAEKEAAVLSIAMKI
ncbi:hypothetical protein BHE74_00046235 [Ensete ventricosum]|nr:hypothetical protein BHE74_00046235 [Ensete ventricosum]